MTEQEFHESRRAFVYLGGRIQFCDKPISHHEWLVDGGLLTDAAFQEVIRGYEDAVGVYFYVGDFETSSKCEAVAKKCAYLFPPYKAIYCGVRRGVIGDKWQPLKVIRRGE